MKLPSVILCAGRTEQTPINDFGLVLDRSEESFGQWFLVAPGLSSVFRLAEPSCPIGHLETYFEEQPQLTVGHLRDNGVPTGLSSLVGRGGAFVHRTFGSRSALSGDACDFGIFRSEGEDTVGSKDGLAPFVGAFLLDAYPDADVGVALMLATKVCGYEVTLLCFNDGSSMTLRKAGMLVEELILRNGCRGCWDFTQEVVFT